MFALMKTKKFNAVVLLPMTIEVHSSYSLLFAAKDGEHGNGLKLEKTGQFFSRFGGDGVLRRSPKIKYE